MIEASRVCKGGDYRGEASQKPLSSILLQIFFFFLQETLKPSGCAPHTPCASGWGAMRRTPYTASGMGLAWVWVRRQPGHLSPRCASITLLQAKVQRLLVMTPSIGLVMRGGGGEKEGERNGWRKKGYSCLGRGSKGLQPKRESRWATGTRPILVDFPSPQHQMELPCCPVLGLEG